MTAARRSQRIFITGASSGIGAALALRYASSGATLGLVARRKDRLEQLAAALAIPCEIYPVDVRDASALAQAAQHFVANRGCPDAVIANAGISVGTLIRFAEDTRAFQEVLDINLIGMVNTFQPFLSCLGEARQGALVGIASVAGYRGLPGSGAYSASKAAVISYLEGLRVELRSRGVKVITICPGFIATPMTSKNPYPMPFLMSAEAAAEKIISLIARGKSYAVIPWQMAIIARLLRVLPNWLYDRMIAGTGRKPRRAA